MVCTVSIIDAINLEMFFVERGDLPLPPGWLPENATKRWEVIIRNPKNKAQETFGYFASEIHKEPGLSALLSYLLFESTYENAYPEDIKRDFRCCCEFKANKIMGHIKRNSVKVKRILGDDFEKIKNSVLDGL